MFSVLELWHLGLCAVGVLLSLADPAIRRIALIYFSVMLLFYVLRGPAVDYGAYWFVLSAFIDATIIIFITGIRSRLVGYLYITCGASALINLIVFAGYHVPALQFAYYIYRWPLAVFEWCQVLSILVFSPPIMRRLAKDRRSAPRDYESWLARSATKHS